MSIKKIFILHLLFVSCSVMADGWNVFFTNYLLTNSVSIDKVAQIKKSSGIYFSKKDILFLEEKSCFREERAVVTSDRRMDIDTVRPIPYAKKVDDIYEITYSDSVEGLYCSLDVRPSEGHLFLEGEFAFFSLVERGVFEPFPQLQAGEPVTIIGGSCQGFLLQSGKSGVASYGLLRGADGRAKSLFITFVRYEPVGKEGEEGSEKGEGVEMK